MPISIELIINALDCYDYLITRWIIKIQPVFLKKKDKKSWTFIIVDVYFSWIFSFAHDLVVSKHKRFCPENFFKFDRIITTRDIGWQCNLIEILNKNLI